MFIISPEDAEKRRADGLKVLAAFEANQPENTKKAKMGLPNELFDYPEYDAEVYQTWLKAVAPGIYTNFITKVYTFGIGDVGSIWCDVTLTGPDEKPCNTRIALVGILDTHGNVVGFEFVLDPSW